MNPITQFIQNFYYKVNRLKVIDHTDDELSVLCLSCESKSVIHKNYGTILFSCICGHQVKVFTGINKHKISGKFSKYKGSLSQKEIADNRKKEKYDIFHKHINSDLMALYNVLPDKRNVTIQVKQKHCLHLLKNKAPEKGYDDLLKYLISFLDLQSIPIKLTWTPLVNESTLGGTRNPVNILGTTYLLQIGSQRFYTVYLNPDVINKKTTLLKVIAHELTHIFMDRHNLTFISPDNERGNKEYDEQMTDLLGIVLGMGTLMHSYDIVSESYDIGYLTNDMIRESAQLWESEFLSGKNGVIRIQVTCSSCNQKLRIPIRKGIRISCPKCKSEYLNKATKGNIYEKIRSHLRIS